MAVPYSKVKHVLLLSLQSIHNDCSSMDHHALNNVLVGHIMATIRSSNIVENRGHPSKTRQKLESYFMHKGMQVSNLFHFINMSLRVS